MEVASAITVSGRSRLRVAQEVPSMPDASATSLASQSAPLSEALLLGAKRLVDLSKLHQDWDSYGSPPVQPAALASASRALAVAVGERAALPFIGPIAGGGIQFEWDAGSRALEIALLPDGAIEYLAVENGREHEARIENEREQELMVRALVRWFVTTHR